MPREPKKPKQPKFGEQEEPVPEVDGYIVYPFHTGDEKKGWTVGYIIYPPGGSKRAFIEKEDMDDVIKAKDIETTIKEKAIRWFNV